MPSGLVPGERTSLGEDVLAGAALAGASVAVCIVGDEENFEDKLDSHDPFLAGDDDICMFCMF